MISVQRFVANKAIDKREWLAAREGRVSATEVAQAATPKGFEAILNPGPPDENIEENPYVKFGLEQEGPISLWVKEHFGIMPNEWLIESKNNYRYVSTPDGLSLDHKLICEIKTSGKDFGEVGIPIHYRRQVQWQLFTTDSEKCLFAWMLRKEVDGQMVPAWWEPKTLWIERDPKMIDQLIDTANQLIERRAENG